jgi:hypothetical protein
MKLQRLFRIRQNFSERKLPDVAAAVRAEMERAAWTQSVPAGSRIAVGVGSRGISNINIITKAVVDFWKSRGAKPFLIPVMGSHGAASAEGQADVLAHYGITEQTMGAPVVSSLEVVRIGTTPEGIDVAMDRTALESDGVMLLSRVKWHTSFEGKLESGVHKMMAIGLGKWEGAKRYHAWGLRIGMETVIRSVGKVVLGTGKMLGGLAILEDAYHNTAEVHALGAEGMVEREEELLRRTKAWKANIPVEEVDLLIVDEMGKNISGTGMDAKVVNRGPQGPNKWPGVPLVRRIFTRDLTDMSYGNAIGIGLTDIVTDRLFHKIDFHATWINSLTASNPMPSKAPIHFPTDRECLEQILPTCGKLDVWECSIVWIRNTMELGEMLASENLIDELEKNHHIEFLTEPQEIEFDDAGNLVAMLAGEALAH